MTFFGLFLTYWGRLEDNIILSELVCLRIDGNLDVIL